VHLDRAREDEPRNAGTQGGADESLRGHYVRRLEACFSFLCVLAHDVGAAGEMHNRGRPFERRFEIVLRCRGEIADRDELGTRRDVPDRCAHQAAIRPPAFDEARA
jgi:hypothetical protein